MTQTTMYVYLGTNGTICSPVHLENIYFVKKVQLVADVNKALTKDDVNYTNMIIIPESEVNDWHEVNISQGQE